MFAGSHDLQVWSLVHTEIHRAAQLLHQQLTRENESK